MKSQNTLIMLLLLSGFFLACEDEPIEINQTASLKVVHAIADAPELYVNTFNENVMFSNLLTLPFGQFERYTFLAEEERDLTFVYEGDTTRQVFLEQVNLRAGQISTLFLIGDSANISTTLVEDVGLKTLKDSLNAIRFINLAEGVNSLKIGLADSSITIAQGLAFDNSTDFIEFDATLENIAYNFTFKNEADSVLTTFRYEQFFVFPFPGFDPFVTSLYDNVTLALVGKSDDGIGNSTLQVIKIDHQ